jgi:hypothetical protein
LVNALKSVDFPTFGKPTIPQLKPMQDSQKLLCKIASNFTTKQR